MNIRKANKEDTNAIVSLVKEGLSGFGFDYSARTSEADLNDIEEAYTNNGGSFLIIEDEGELVATGALKKISDGIFKIRKMYVQKRYRNQGYGKKILESLLQEASNKKAKVINLETSKLMKSAIALYRSYGFEESEGKAESPRCDMLMTKKL
ncbi:MAG: GNAT family N-acetyltransferase [Ekhidna sp.]|uniref:GNAT family N-acetyltransferase n=1 Tax=Ekhidna sp. TaxID=2608089 RepID=UPI0032EAB9B6